MEDRNSPEEMAKRSGQEDPIVMYLIVKQSLDMSIGKTAAQCAHASQMLQLRFQEMDQELIRGWNVSVNSANMSLFREWLDASFRKVVLQAKDKDWQKIKDACPNHIVVVDAGLTEIPAGSETFIGLWPMRKSERPKIIQKLQTLK